MSEPKKVTGKRLAYPNHLYPAKVPVILLEAAPLPERDNWLGYIPRNDACIRLRQWVFDQDALVAQCISDRPDKLPGDYSDQRHGNSDRSALKTHDFDMWDWAADRFYDSELRDRGYRKIFDEQSGYWGKGQTVDKDEAGGKGAGGVVTTYPVICNFARLIVWANNNREHGQAIADYLARVHVVTRLYWDGFKVVERFEDAMASTFEQYDGALERLAS